MRLFNTKLRRRIKSSWLTARGRLAIKLHLFSEKMRDYDGDTSDPYYHSRGLLDFSWRIKHHLSRGDGRLRPTDVPLATVMVDIAQRTMGLSYDATKLALDHIGAIVSSKTLEGTAPMDQAKFFLYRHLAEEGGRNDFDILSKIVSSIVSFGVVAFDREYENLLPHMAKKCLKHGADGLALYMSATTFKNATWGGSLSPDEVVDFSTFAAQTLLDSAPEKMWKEVLSTAFETVPPNSEMKKQLGRTIVDNWDKYEEEHLAEAREAKQHELFIQLRRVALEVQGDTREDAVGRMSKLIDSMPKNGALQKDLWLAYDYDPTPVAALAFAKLQEHRLPTHPLMRSLVAPKASKL